MLRLSDLLFSLALLFCPPAFRREYGAAVRDDFRTASAEERDVHGPLAAAVYALGAAGDLLLTGLREYAAMIVRDLIYSLRSLRKTPSFAAVVMLTLALAIGANAAVFSIIHAVVLSPLPYADPDRLVTIDPHDPAAPSMSLPDYADLRAATGGIFDKAASYDNERVTMTGHGTPRVLTQIETTPGLFDTLGAAVQIGRFANASEGMRGAAKTVVISDSLWRSQFSADPAAVGSIIQLDGESYRIIGVAPAGFQQPRLGRGFQAADIWTFLPENGAGTDYAQRGYHVFQTIAHLRDGIDAAGADAAIRSAARRLDAKYPLDDATFSAGVSTLTESLVGSSRPLLFALFVAVAGVLFVACANVANLLLSRATAREREFSVRIAIGASRGRIVAQLLIESFVLAFGGGAIGIAIAFGIVDAFRTLHPTSIPRADFVTVDGASILFTLGVVAFCTFAAGIVPGLSAARRDVATALKSAGRGGDASAGARARNVLAITEIAMTLALVVAAGLVVRSYVVRTAQPLGFEPANLAIVGPIDLPDRRYGTNATRVVFMDRVMDKIRSLPGITSAGWAYSVPFTKSHFGTQFAIVGRTFPPGRDPDSFISPTGTGFFEALRATFRSGRTFSPADRAGSLPVAIVNASFARAFFPGGSAIGKQIVPEVRAEGEKVAPPRTIVGVVDDLRDTFQRPVDPTIYVPEDQFAQSGSSIVVRSTNAGEAGAAIATAVESIDPLLARPNVVPMDSLLTSDVGLQRLAVFALCSLAFVALVLSIAGVFAVVGYGVTQRTHEFGIRMALGAEARHILRNVLAGAVRLALTGVVLGLVVAAAGTRLLTGVLYETEPLDPSVFVSVAFLVILAALVAALVPARRATRVDPIVALRYE